MKKNKIIKEEYTKELKTREYSGEEYYTTYKYTKYKIKGTNKEFNSLGEAKLYLKLKKLGITKKDTNQALKAINAELDIYKKIVKELESSKELLLIRLRVL